MPYDRVPVFLHKRILQKKLDLERLGKLSKRKIEQIRKRMEIDFVFHSNKIEGSALSRGETELILQGITLGKKSIPEALAGKNLGDILVAQNHPDAIDIVKKIAFDKNHKITEDEIKKIHKTLMNGVIASAGTYRQYELAVKGAGFTPPPFYEIPKHIKDLLHTINENPDELRPIEFAAQVHYDFVWAHPFEDGNGRMARLLLNLILVKNKYPFVVIKSTDRPQYLRALRQIDLNDDFEPFLTYIAKCVEQTLDLYLVSDEKSVKMQSLSELAGETPHSAEYWSLLARKGRIYAIKEGKTWMTTKKTLREYLNEQKERC